MWGGGKKKIYISDDACKIAFTVKYQVDQSLKNFFLKSGYVGANRTLFSNIYTLLPGQCIRINKISGKIKEENYFNLDYTVPTNTDISDEELLIELDKTFHVVFQDLILRVKNKNVIVPLSGGCDSRIIVTTLKKLGIENVYCVSYGRSESFEIKIAKEVADKLGYPWIYSEYTGEMWRNFFNSLECKKFLKYATKGGYGIGCIQAVPAFLDLKNRGLLPEDAIVIPGHALDFLAGSHLPDINESETWSKEKILDYIRRSHYMLNSKVHVELEKAVKFEKEYYSRKEVVHYIMEWEYNNRQSKFIANDVRAYEFCGYSFELPFWDMRICKFFMSLPYEKLYKRNLQYKYMLHYIDPYIGYKQIYDLKWKLKNKRNIIKKYLRPFVKSFIDIKIIKNKWKDHYTNVDAFFDWLSFREYLQMFFDFGINFSLNSIVVRDYINRRLWDNEKT